MSEVLPGWGSYVTPINTEAFTVEFAATGPWWVHVEAFSGRTGSFGIVRDIDDLLKCCDPQNFPGQSGAEDMPDDLRARIYRRPCTIDPFTPKSVLMDELYRIGALEDAAAVLRAIARADDIASSLTEGVL